MSEASDRVVAVVELTARDGVKRTTIIARDPSELAEGYETLRRVAPAIHELDVLGKATEGLRRR